MQYKSLYTPEQWETIKNSLEWVLGAVAGADGKIDQKELDAVKKIHRMAEKFEQPFIKEVLNSIPDEEFDQITLASDTDIKEGLSVISTYLKVLSREEASDFKKFLLFSGMYVGMASGRFLQSKISEIEEDKLELIGRLIQYDYDSFIESGIYEHYLSIVE